MPAKNEPADHSGKLVDAPVVTLDESYIIYPKSGLFDGVKSLEDLPPQTPRITVTNTSLSKDDTKKESCFLPSPLSIVTGASESFTTDLPLHQKRVVSVPNSIQTDPSDLTHNLTKRSGRRSASDNTEASSSQRTHWNIEELQAFSMSYNEYGELVDPNKTQHPINPEELNVTQTLRLVYKRHHDEFTTKLRDIVSTQVEHDAKNVSGEDAATLQKHLSIWGLVVKSPFSTIQASPKSEVSPNVKVFQGPPRVLEIGCADGAWCCSMKKDHPDWIIEGLDDRDRWSVTRHETKFKNFMDPMKAKDGTEYFGTAHNVPKDPEFTVRNINSLIDHADPIPNNFYSFVRGRDIFDRVESYRSFLNDVRLILQPDGVIEFIELDPRPRVHAERRQSNTRDRKNGPMFDWGDSIADRFKNPTDDQLETGCPEWNQRVEERIKASMRPRDGNSGEELKGRLQGGGFWDVKEIILRIPIGGETEAGQLLLEEMIRQVELENQIPLLAKKLPQVDLKAVTDKKPFFINCHIVTARKPKAPRPGDLLLDGSRQEMTASKYDTMARVNDSKSNQWMRYENDKELTNLMKGLSTLHTEPSAHIGHPKKDKGENYSFATSVATTPAQTRPNSPTAKPQDLCTVKGKSRDSSD